MHAIITLWAVFISYYLVELTWVYKTFGKHPESEHLTVPLALALACVFRSHTRPQSGLISCRLFEIHLDIQLS